MFLLADPSSVCLVSGTGFFVWLLCRFINTRCANDVLVTGFNAINVDR